MTDQQEPRVRPAVEFANRLPTFKHPLKRWVFFHPFLTIALVGVLCYFAYEWFMGPSVNSQPKERIVIQGSFPFSKGFDLVLRVSYSSQNLTCRQMARTLLIFPAAEVDRQQVLVVPIQREGEDRYRAEIALDHFSPGFCEWAYSGMTYQIKGNKQSDTGGDGLGDIPQRANRAEAICRYREAFGAGKLLVSCDIKKKPNDDNLHGAAQFDFLWEGAL